MRLVAAKHHVAAGLASKNESDALQGDKNLSAR
jgi:hypothetical protein